MYLHVFLHQNNTPKSSKKYNHLLRWGISCLIETAYSLTDNPFFYLMEESYKNDFNLSYDTLYDWEEKDRKGEERTLSSL